MSIHRNRLNKQKVEQKRLSDYDPTSNHTADGPAVAYEQREEYQL